MIIFIALLSFLTGFFVSYEMWKIAARRDKEQMEEAGKCWEDDQGRMVKSYKEKK